MSNRPLSSISDFTQVKQWPPEMVLPEIDSLIELSEKELEAEILKQPKGSYREAAEWIVRVIKRVQHDEDLFEMLKSLRSSIWEKGNAAEASVIAMRFGLIFAYGNKKHAKKLGKKAISDQNKENRRNKDGERETAYSRAVDKVKMFIKAGEHPEHTHHIHWLDWVMEVEEGKFRKDITSIKRLNEDIKVMLRKEGFKHLVGQGRAPKLIPK